jgi:hypothetical protein
MPTSQSRKPDLTLILDFGGSLTKGIYRDKDGQPKLLLMEPEVSQVQKSSLDKYESRKLGKSNPVDSAWVGVDDDFFAVGFLAKVQFNGIATTNSLKYERAYIKTLAAVWAACVELGLNKKKKIRAALGVLLPASEQESTDELKHYISSWLPKFITPTGVMSVELISYHCKPEGGGVFQAYTNSQGAALIKSKTIALVMVGYRNASILLLERGQLTKLLSSNFGFIRLVEEVTKRISTVLDTAGVANAIIKANHAQYWGTDEQEQKLVQAIAPSREQYWLALKTWLRDNLPKKLDEVILCGGTAHFMKQELEQHFQHSELIWDGNLELPDKLCGDELGQRMSDAYGMYLCFNQGNSKAAKAVRNVG